MPRDQDRFMFPGQGSYEAGMGRDVAEAVPEAMAVYEAGSAASGLDLKQICFHDPVENLLDTKLQQPALVATSLAIDEAIRARGITPDFVVGHSVGEFAALGAAQSIASADAIGLVTERGSRWREAARSGRARWPRSSASPTRSSRASAGRSRCLARELQLSRSDRRLRRGRRGRRVLYGGRARRRAPGRAAPRLGGVPPPLVERAADKLRPAVEKIQFADPADSVHVDRDREAWRMPATIASCSCAS